MATRIKSILIALGARVIFDTLRKMYMTVSDHPAVWKREIARFKEQDRLSPPREGGIVFTGSSSITYWQTLEQDMAPLCVINRGFGGAKMRQVVFYADGIVVPHRPAAVVLFAGSNDLCGFNKKTAQKVFYWYTEFVRIIHASLPSTHIYYVAITPTPARWKDWPLAREANCLIEAYTNTDKRLSFIDMTEAILGSDGQPRRDLFLADGVHPSAKGYVLWTSLIKPILEADLCKQRKEDA